MKLAKRTALTASTVVGAAATYVPLILSTRGVAVAGLAWQYWAIVGFTVFWVSMAIVVWQQYRELKQLQSEDAEADRQKRKLEIEERALNIEELKARRETREAERPTPISHPPTG